MPKSKSANNNEEKTVAAPAEEAEKIIEIDEDGEVLDDDLLESDDADDLEDDEAGLDEEEVDPFNDKWEQ